MEAIRDFFNNLGCAINNGQRLDDAARLSHHINDMIYLTINRLDYIARYLSLSLRIWPGSPRKIRIIKIERQS